MGILEAARALYQLLTEELRRADQNWRGLISREDHAEMSNSTPFYNRRGSNVEEIAPDLKQEFTPRHQEIGRKGGLAASEKGTLHRFTPDEAARGGAKGGKTRASQPGVMAEMGRKGAKVAAENRRRRKLEKERQQAEERERAEQLEFRDRIAAALERAASWRGGSGESGTMMQTKGGESNPAE